MRKLIAILGVIALFFLAGCSDDDGGSGDSDKSADNKDKSTALSIDEPATVESSSGGKATVKILSAEWKTEGGKPEVKPLNGAFLVVQVEFSGEGSSNPAYFSFRADDDMEYTAGDAKAAGFTPGLPSGDLAGKTVTGYVVIDAPESAGEIVLTNAVMKEVAAWELPKK